MRICFPFIAPVKKTPHFKIITSDYDMTANFKFYSKFDMNLDYAHKSKVDRPWCTHNSNGFMI